MLHIIGFNRCTTVSATTVTIYKYKQYCSITVISTILLLLQVVVVGIVAWGVVAVFVLVPLLLIRPNYNDLN